MHFGGHFAGGKAFFLDSRLCCDALQSMLDMGKQEVKQANGRMDGWMDGIARRDSLTQPHTTHEPTKVDDSEAIFSLSRTLYSIAP